MNLKYIKLLLVFGFLSLSLMSVKALAASYTIDPTHSSIGFSVRHIFTPVKGYFGEFGGSFSFDPKSGKAADIKIDIKAASIDTKNKKRDDHLRGSDFFDVEKFPQATFRSKKIKKAGVINNPGFLIFIKIGFKT